MFNRKQLVAFIVVFAAHDIYTNIQHTRTLKRFRSSIDDNETQIDRIKYLCHLLVKHDVPVDEFDVIAFTHLM